MISDNHLHGAPKSMLNNDLLAIQRPYINGYGVH